MNIKYLYLVSMIEGAALMATEIIGSKIMAPYFGTSLTVWTSIFICTLSSLAIGYYFGAKFSEKKNSLKLIFYTLLISLSLLLIMHPLSYLIMDFTLGLGLVLGSLISCCIFLSPILICFGIISPLIIKTLTISIENTGKKASLVYTISTFGGVISTILFGTKFIPEIGIKNSLLITILLISICTIITLLILKQNESKQKN